MYSRGGGNRGRGGGRSHGGRGRGCHGGRGRGRGRGGRGRGRNNNRGPLQYNPAAFDPIEEIGDTDSSKPTVRIAIEGCCHGELDVIYQRLQDHEQATGKKMDLLLCCGDFQSHRNPADFHSSSIPPKYRNLGTFPSYYSGAKKAPILTVFIGGNHEASQPLRELYYGGWVAPNIYYMGAAGVVRFAGLRIGGLSGIYKSHDYHMGHFESVPYDKSSLRSVYHVRNVDVLRMKCLSIGHNLSKETARDDNKANKLLHRRPMDIIMSHDWPLGIEQHGNTNDLLRRKPYFRQEVAENNLGSPPNREVLDVVRPKHWFSAHLHVKFKATVRFPANYANERGENTSDDFMALIPSQVIDQKPMWDDRSCELEEASGETSSKDVADTADNTQLEAAETPTTEFHGLESSKCVSGEKSIEDLTEQMTRFLALDKCLPRRQFLSVLNLEVQQPAAEIGTTKEETEQADSTPRFRLEYDPEWLAILRKTHELTCPEKRRVDVAQDPNQVMSPEELAKEANWVVSRLRERGGMAIPEDFMPTVPLASDPVFQGQRNLCRPLPLMGNAITDKLLDLLQLEHILTQPFDPTLTPQRLSSMLQNDAPPTSLDDNEIDLDMDEDDEKPAAKDDNEIDIDDEAAQDENEIDIDDNNDEDNGNESHKKARLDDDTE